jgi:arginine:ornithine antiporter/lysine permease
MTTVLIQIMLFVTLASENAFDFMLNMTSAVSLFPFVLAAGYALRLVVTKETYREQPDGRNRDMVVAVLATAYTVFLLFAAGPKYMLISLILYAPGTVLFAMARREQGRVVFSRRELIIFAVSIIGAITGVVALAAGWIAI